MSGWAKVALLLAAGLVLGGIGAVFSAVWLIRRKLRQRI